MSVSRTGLRAGLPFDDRDIRLNDFARRDYWGKVFVVNDDHLETADGSPPTGIPNVPLKYETYLKHLLSLEPQ